MSNGKVFEIIIGALFLIPVLSLIAGAVTEALASALKWRSSSLLDGVRALCDEARIGIEAESFYDHAASVRAERFQQVDKESTRKLPHRAHNGSASSQSRALQSQSGGSSTGGALDDGQWAEISRPAARAMWYLASSV